VHTRSNQPIVEVSLRGGIGNQLFQYFAGLEIAIKRNQDLQLDDSLILDRKSKHSSIHFLNVMAAFKSYETHKYVKRINRYTDAIQSRSAFMNRLLVNASRRNVIKEVGFSADIYKYKSNEKLLGYFQTWRHFDYVQKNCQIALIPPHDYGGDIFAGVEPSSAHANIALHVRRGDYVALRNTFGILDKNYYQDALRSFEYDRDVDQVCVFTDATSGELKELFNLDEMNIRIIDSTCGLSDVEQLILMSKFKRIIIANSSYSWWAACLSGSETLVAAPKKWYKSMPSPIDLIPKNWIQIENDWL
jgi:hypothetical protein